MISEINCSYYILDISSPIQILNDEFLNDTNIILRVNGIEQNFSKYILFEKNETNEIQIIINDKFNLDYMFKDILSLIQINIHSNNSVEITSMEGVLRI